LGWIFKLRDFIEHESNHILFKKITTMKNLKYRSLMMALICTLSLGFTACNDDDDEINAPAITIEEANIEGDELCVEADIIAEGKTAAITINITDKTGKTNKATKVVTDTKYIGVLNISGFHVHVDIADKNVIVGDLLHLSVTDANGKQTTAKKSITQEEEDND